MSFSLVGRLCEAQLRQSFQAKMCRRKIIRCNTTYTLVRHCWSRKRFPVLSSGVRAMSAQPDKVGQTLQRCVVNLDRNLCDMYCFYSALDSAERSRLYYVKKDDIVFLVVIECFVYVTILYLP